MTKVTLVAGNNSQGKTSLFNAVQMLLTAEPRPLNLAKSKCGSLIRSGSSESHAAIRITGEDGFDVKQVIKWPSAVLEGDGVVLASPLATGRIRLGALDTKQRAQILTETLKATPTHKDFVLEMQDQELLEKVSEEVWEKIMLDGWDVEWKTRKEHGATLKGRWEGITGDHYGSAKAKTWLPGIWRDELTTASRDSLEIALVDAKADHETVIARSAITIQEAANLQALAGMAPEIEASRNALSDKLEGYTRGKDGLLEQRSNIGPLEQSYHTCPHPECGLPVQIENRAGESVLIQAVAVNDSDIEANKAASSKLETKISDLSEIITVANRDLEGIKTRLREAENAREQLAKQPDGQTDKATADEVNAAREAVAAAERDLRSFLLWREATAQQNDIATNQKIVDVLAPEGLRRAKLNSALEKFHSVFLDPICDLAGWKRVKIEGDMSISYGGRSYPLARNEKWKTAAALQIAVGCVEQSAMVILDDADALDLEGRNGLFVMLEKLKQPSLVCMLANKDKLPDLGASGFGSTFWIENGSTSIFVRE